jgi:hypothetical protein
MKGYLLFGHSMSTEIMTANHIVVNVKHNIFFHYQIFMSGTCGSATLRDHFLNNSLNLSDNILEFLHPDFFRLTKMMER